MNVLRLSIAAAVAAVAAIVISTTTMVAAQDAAKEPGPLVGIGEDIWRAGPSCWNCHGNMASGDNEDPRSPRGADLRADYYTVAIFAEAIRCGRPGTPMPYFGGRNAYAGNNPCYGLTAEQLGANLPPQGLETYNARQIDALAQFLWYQFVGNGPVTQEECRAFYGDDASSCNRWPTMAEVEAAAAAPAEPAAAPAQ